MGEYIEVGGQMVKIGTCEDLYYIRFDDLREVVKTAKQIGGNLEPVDYLKPEHGFRYRFPFPDEDNLGAFNYDDYDKGLLIFLSPELAPELIANLPTWEHYTIAHPCNYHGTCHVNIMTTCPLCDEPPKNMTEPSKAVVISQQKQADGELWVVIACPYCGAKVRIDRLGALELASCVLAMGKDENSSKYWREVARRVMAGYKEGET
jgi:hypothetical protein